MYLTDYIDEEPISDHILFLEWGLQELLIAPSRFVKFYSTASCAAFTRAAQQWYFAIVKTPILLHTTMQNILLTADSTLLLGLLHKRKQLP